jgi:hypothetical protein
MSETKSETDVLTDEILQLLCSKGVTYGRAKFVLESAVHSIQNVGKTELWNLPVRHRINVKHGYSSADEVAKDLFICPDAQKEDVKSESKKKPDTLWNTFDDGKRMAIRTSAVVALRECDDGTEIYFGGTKISTSTSFDEIVRMMGGTIPAEDQPTPHQAVAS